VAETMVNAQLINWFQDVEIKFRQIAFVLPTITPKKSKNMSRIFFGWDIFFTTRGAWRADFVQVEGAQPP
jgi:hypothetical protein